MVPDAKKAHERRTYVQNGKKVTAMGYVRDARIRAI